MAYAFVVASNVVPASGVSGGTTSAIDTTGADLIVLAVNYYDTSSVTVSDSKGNTWTALTRSTAAADASCILYYCQAPTVGSGHTFTIAGSNTYSRITAAAFSGSTAAPFDVQNGGTATSGTTIQPGSITPSVNDCLLVTAMAWNPHTTASTTINSGFTETADQAPALGANYGLHFSYLVHTSGAINPTVTGSAAFSAAACRIAAFKPSGGGGAGYVPPHRVVSSQAVQRAASR